MPQASYEYAVGRISQLSTKMLDAPKLRRIYEAGSVQESLALLLETGYGGNLSPEQIASEEIDYVIREQLQMSRKLVWEVTPAPELTSLFLLEVDGHNLKTLLKARLLGVEAPDVLIDGGSFPLEQLKECVATANYEALPEAYRNTMNKIEAEQRLVEKIRRIKYLKDQLVWESGTDVIWALQTHRPAFLEKRPWYNCLPSLESLTNTPDGIAALKEAHAALKNPTAKRKTDPEPLSPEELSRGAVVKDTLNTFEVRSAFLGGSQDLMTFLSNYTFSEQLSEEDRLTLFCRLAVEFDEDFRITDRYEESGGFTYPLIFAR